MAFDITNPAGADATRGWYEKTGLESGAGALIKFPDWADECVVEYIPDAPGNAAVKFTLDEATPTDDTGYTTTNIGTVSAQGAQVVSKCSWLAFVPASGTWTARFLFKKV